jgi:hypothetical protein
MRHLFTILACCCCIIVTAQTTTLSKAAYSIRYPADWFLEPGADTKTFTVKAPADSGLIDNFVENLNMVVNDVTGYDAKQYAAFSKGYLPQKIKQFVVLEDKKGSFAGKDSWFMVFKGIQFGKKLQWKQYYIMKGSKVHILTFTCEAIRYKQYIKTVDAMIASYVVK